jgi:ATP-dependent DNA ligase
MVPSRWTPNLGSETYISRMPSRPFQPCIPTRATKVPVGRDWIHEIKHDGYRLIVQKDQKRVRLFTRNGHDWTDRSADRRGRTSQSLRFIRD